MAPKDPLDIPGPRRAPPVTPRRRRRGLSWRWYVVMFVAVLIAIAGVGWLIGGRPRALLVVRMPAQSIQPAAPARPAPPGVQTQAQSPPPPQAAKPPDPPRAVKVDSVPAAETYPLADWHLEKAGSGYLDAVAFSGTAVEPAAIGTLRDSDTVTLRGWAGDTDLGVRFHRVVISLCDRVVGDAPVDQPRLDVARQVHPNLTDAGWSAILLVGHLPRCDGAKLAAWAVAPFGRILFPLLGAVPFPLAPPHGIDPALKVETGKPIRPEDADAPNNQVAVEIKGAHVNMRRCGATSCKVVGGLARGKHAAIKLDARNGWTLLVVPGASTGWIADSVTEIAPLKP